MDRKSTSPVRVTFTWISGSPRNSSNGRTFSTTERGPRNPWLKHQLHRAHGTVLTCLNLPLQATWDSVFQMKFDGQFNADGTQNTAPFDIYLDNIYFWSDGGPADVLGCIDENAVNYDDTANTQSLDQYVKQHLHLRLL